MRVRTTTASCAKPRTKLRPVREDDAEPPPRVNAEDPALSLPLASKNAHSLIQQPVSSMA
jgi:hypothetical protein